MDEFIFRAGAALEDAHQVLNTLLARLDHLSNADFIGHVADDWETALVGFTGRCEVRV